jgi:hypothetical protein
MLFEYKIIWEKWKDPLGYDDNDNILSSNIQRNEHEDSETLVETSVKKIKSNVISTPFGIIPINENTASGEIFNFWTGHANFAITREIADIIEETEGIETFNVFTKYRFRIAVGKAFIDSIIMRNINDNVYSFLKKK